MLMRLNGRQDRPADGKGNALAAQRLDELWRRRRGQSSRRHGGRIVKQRTVLSDDPVEQLATLERRQQIIELATGHHDEPPTRVTKTMQRGESGSIDFPVVGQRAVVIRSQSLIAHRAYSKENSDHPPGERRPSIVGLYDVLPQPNAARNRVVISAASHIFRERID